MKIKQYFSKNWNKEIGTTFLGLAIIAISGGYLSSLYIVAKEENAGLERRIDSSESARLIAIAKAGSVSKKLGKANSDVRDLQGAISGLSGTVTTLQKYVDTDKQLLEKYSKIYFLNENYIPESLATIDSSYNFEKSRTLEFHAKAYPFLVKLMGQAKANNLNLLIASAYRSFGTQSSLKASYRVTFGAKTANSFSADQGYSEHQLGTALDFTTPAVGGALTGFEKTPEYKWLLNNAYKYGFIISYPTNNTYYIFEPWHFRFVGIALATYLHDQGKNFYDMDQRDINGYLVKIFDGL
ncbi:MAG: M15 family metallopeptidase [Patescibacteria group bacterium]